MISKGIPCTARRLLDELSVEVGVVGGEHAAREPRRQFGEGLMRPRRRTKCSPSDAVDVARPDTVPPMAQPNERRPTVDDRAVGIDGDDGDLQDVVAARTQARRFDVDDGEPGFDVRTLRRRRHTDEPSGRVSWRFRSPTRGTEPPLQQLGGEAGDIAALAGGQRDVAEAALAAECLGEHGEGVVRLAEIGSVDLARVPGEDDLAVLRRPE